MKKKYLFALLLFLFPYYVSAIGISSVSITGDSTVYTKKSIPLNLSIKFNNYGDLGIAVVSYRLTFNKYAFEITDVNTTGTWDSKVYKDEDDKFYVVSAINTGTNNRCSDGLLYCGNYEATITFYAKDTDTIESDEIIIDEVQLGLLNTDYADKEIDIDEVILFEGNNSASKVVNIEKSGVIKGFVYKPIEISETKPKIGNDTANITKKKSNSNYIKSDNNHLEKLEIEGYKIKFRTLTNDYSIRVKEGVNNLKVSASPISSKAKYKIIGADNLEKNNNEVQIEVTAENGDKNIYTIKVEYEEEISIPVKKEKEEKEGIDKKYYTIGGCVLGGIILIIIVIKSVFWIRDYKLSKQLNKI